MQYALVNNNRESPQPKLRGKCPACGQECLSKCGSRIIWHWAHHGRLHCDPWWENETEWHLQWKSLFPEAFREIVDFDNETGEKHVADIKTERGLVIELQHSAMPPEELQAREQFYKRMIWIVDATGFAGNFEVQKDPLPHPNAEILDDVVFFPNLASAFWRKSEQMEGSRMVEMHPSELIGDQIRDSYRGHHFFKRKKPRSVWFSSTVPVFLDFGDQCLYGLEKYGNSGQWCVQRISKKALVIKNGGTYQDQAKGG